MSRYWFLSFFFAVLLTIASILIHPEKYALFWWSFHTSYLGALLFLCCALMILVRNVRTFLAYLVELPQATKKRYQNRLYIWIILHLGWFLLIIDVYPLIAAIVTLLLTFHELKSWRNKQRRALPFLVGDGKKKERKIDAKC